MSEIVWEMTKQPHCNIVVVSIGTIFQEKPATTWYAKADKAIEMPMQDFLEQIARSFADQWDHDGEVGYIFCKLNFDNHEYCFRFNETAQVQFWGEVIARPIAPSIDNIARGRGVK